GQDADAAGGTRMGLAGPCCRLEIDALGTQADEKVTRETISIPVCILRCTPLSARLPWCSHSPQQQCAQSDQVVGRGREGDDPVDQFVAAVAQLAQSATVFIQPKTCSISLRLR